MSPQFQRFSRQSIFLHLWVLAVTALLIHLFFLNKAYHIDDPVFYYTAKQILKDPLRAYSFQLNWLGRPQMGFDFLSNPPGISYYLAMIIRLFGDSEKILHSSFIPFSLMSAFAMYFLAKRFCKYPFSASMLLILSPIFVIMAHSVMPDLPLASLFILTAALFVYGSDRRNKAFLVLSGITASVVVLLRYNGLAIIPLLLLYYLLHWEKKKMWDILVLVFPIAAFLAWNIFTYLLYGKSHFLFHLSFQVGRNVNWQRTVFHLAAHLCYLGGGSLFALFFFLPLLEKSITKKLAFIALVGGMAFLALRLRDQFHYDTFHAVLASTFICAILFFLLSNIIDATKRASVGGKREFKDYIFFLFWIIGVLIMQNRGIHASAKYMIIVLPPTLILVVQALESIDAKYRRVMLFLFVTLTGVMSVTAAVADYEFAEVNRKIVRQCQELPLGKKNHIWFVGHWGAQYYMQEEGFLSYALNSNSPKKGDFIVISSLSWPEPVGQQLLARCVLYDKAIYFGEIPLKIMHNREGKHASFYAFINYSIGYGLLPYSISGEPIDEFDILQVITD